MSNNAEQLWRYFKQRTLVNTEDARLRNAIALQNVKLARKEAHNWAARCPEAYEDLEQIAFIGLTRAVERFNPTKGAAFSSFAVPYIKGAILHHLRDHGSSVKIPRRWRELNSSINKTEQLWAAAHGRLPSDREIADQLNIKLEQVTQVRGAIANQKGVALNEELHQSLEESGAIAHEDVSQPALSQSVETALRALKANYHNLTHADKKLLRQVYFERLSRKAIARSMQIEVDVLNARLIEILSRVV